MPTPAPSRIALALMATEPETPARMSIETHLARMDPDEAAELRSALTARHRDGAYVITERRAVKIFALLDIKIGRSAIGEWRRTQDG